ncbi:MAG: hypothetical protein IKM72_17565 [Oscillospiraceae bacterium]|nr:hypothetical protein [Oscillospiraceae bacterium]MBR6984193.1 hypothetical protein [Ruminococcus sp.]
MLSLSSCGPIDVESSINNTNVKSNVESEKLQDYSNASELIDILKSTEVKQSNVTSYSANELLNFIDYYASVNLVTPICDLHKRFPIEHIFEPEKAVPYCIYRLDTGEKMFVFFDDGSCAARPVSAVFIVKDDLTFESFKSLEEGMTLADVEAIDSGTKLMDTVKNHPLGRGNTLHMTKDGFVKITYTVGNFKNAPIPEDSEEFKIEKVEFIPNGGDIEITYMDEIKTFTFKFQD